MVDGTTSLRYPAEPLTVDADDFDHGEGEKGQRCHVHLDQHSGDQKHHQDHREAAGDPQFLRNPGIEEEKQKWGTKVNIQSWDKCLDEGLKINK